MSSGGSCLIGGNVACDAGGERAVKYGTTRAQVTGVEAVLMDGTLIRCGGKLAKNVAGYALHHLLVGSEGTLAVITEITLRLVPRAPFHRTLLAAFGSLDAAAEAALAVEASGYCPSAVELIERAGAALAEEMLGQKLPYGSAAALLLVEVEGFGEARAQEEIEAVGGILLEAGADEVDLAKREKVWGVRHAVSEAIKRQPAYSAIDAVVPRRRMPALIREAHRVASRHGLEVVCFGHAGDGNIHVDFVKRRVDDPKWEAGIAPAIREVLEATVRMGGSITAEHGVGLLRLPDMELQFDAGTIEAMRALKRAWDPKGLLNPGKIWTS
ncbi:MAG: FAD-binding protein [Planctomycetes bacterium]|nr:FAD-binding protein [Planctomycetota bacterium]